MEISDIIYDQPQNESFSEKLESVQCHGALATTGAKQGTSCDKIYHELALESLKSRRWYKGLSWMFETIREEASNYLINLVPNSELSLLLSLLLSLYTTLFFLVH